MRPGATDCETAGPLGGDRRSTLGAWAAGFSLPELLVVLVVVGILSVLVLPQIEVVRYRMDGAARGMMAALVTAQRSAVKRQHDVVVAFDSANRRIRIHEDANNDGTRDSGERVRVVALSDRVRFGLGPAPTRTWGSPGAITFTEQQDGLPAVSFHRNGSASEQGAFYLTSERSKQGPPYANDARSIQLDRATGRASWYYFESPQWKQGF